MADSSKNKLSFTAEQLESVGLDLAESGSSVIEVAFYLSQQDKQRSEEVLAAIKEEFGEEVAELIGKLSDLFGVSAINNASSDSVGGGHDGLKIPQQGESSPDAPQERILSEEEIKAIVERMLELFNEYVKQYVNNDSQYKNARASFMRGIKVCFGDAAVGIFESEVPATLGQYQQQETANSSTFGGTPQPTGTPLVSSSTTLESAEPSPESQIGSGP